jgi:hypothetical protein
MSWPEFSEVLSSNLNRGKSFRDHLDLHENPFEQGETHRDKIIYFYSSMHDTVSRVNVDGDSAHSLPNMRGDGRVTADSAMNKPYYSTTPEPLSSTHSELIKDGRFIEWLGVDLSKDVGAQRVVDEVDALSRVPAGRRVLAENNELLANAADLWLQENVDTMVSATVGSLITGDPPASVAERARRGMEHVYLKTLAIRQQSTPSAISLKDIPDVDREKMLGTIDNAAKKEHERVTAIEAENRKIEKDSKFVAERAQRGHKVIQQVADLLEATLR